jgi:hypothetical protein
MRQRIKNRRRKPNWLMWKNKQLILTNNYYPGKYRTVLTLTNAQTGQMKQNRWNVIYFV